MIICKMYSRTFSTFACKSFSSLVRWSSNSFTRFVNTFSSVFNLFSNEMKLSGHSLCIQHRCMYVCMYVELVS